MKKGQDKTKKKKKQINWEATRNSRFPIFE